MIEDIDSDLAAVEALDERSRREYERVGTTDADGIVFDPSALAVDSENAGLDDTDPVATSLI